MRGLSTLSSSRSKQKARGLPNLNDKSSSKFNYEPLNAYTHGQTQSKSHFPCAYHVGEKITNFCVHPNCLLPLCPKCIKIHSQQHEKIGVHGNFATVDQCIEECQVIQSQSVCRLQQILQVCEDMSCLHKQQLFICREQLQKAKEQIQDYIHSVFAFYEEQVDKIILQTSKEYEEQLLTYHKEIATLMVGEKQLVKKSENPHLKLEFLIDFYSRSDLTVLLNTYAARIQAIKPDYLQLSINTYELERIKVIVKKYLDFGSLNPEIQKRMDSNLRYQRVTMVSKAYQSSQPQTEDNRFQSIRQLNKLEPLKQFVRSPIKNLFSTPLQFQPKPQSQSYAFTQKGQIAKLISQNLKRQSMLDSFHSPLQKFSLQKSRKTRT